MLCTHPKGDSASSCRGDWVDRICMGSIRSPVPSHHSSMSMRSPSAPIGHGTVAPSEDVLVVGAALPDFSGDSLRQIPVAILNYLGCSSPDWYALLSIYLSILHQCAHYGGQSGGRGHSAIGITMCTALSYWMF